MTRVSEQVPFDARGEGGVSTSARSLRPKLAATLVLVRGADAPHVLMGRRAEKHAFMPRKFVFPGGGVDRADAYGPADGPLRAPDLRRLESALSATRARAAPLAAIRETAEETGILFGRATAPDRDSRAAQWSAFRSRGLAPAPSRLSILARAITPPGRKRRFDAWFFLGRAEDVDLNAAAPETAELEDVDWYTLKDARELDLPLVTRFVLEEAEQRLMASALADAPPFLRVVRGHHVIERL